MEQSAKKSGKARPARRDKTAGPRPVTAGYLRNSAMHYLSQRAASAAMVRQVLERRAKRRLQVNRLDEDVVALIAAGIAALIELGMINDKTFAENRALTLARRGMSRQRIGQGLQQKGIAREAAKEAIGDDVDDLGQARRLVERKRLGAFRRGEASEASRAKDLRVLARAGFSYEVAKKALDASTDDEP